MQNVQQIFYIKYNDTDGYINTLKDPQGYNALSDTEKQQFTQVVVDLKHLTGWGKYWDHVRYVNGALSYPDNYPASDAETIEDLKNKLNDSINSNIDTKQVTTDLKNQFNNNSDKLNGLTDNVNGLNDKMSKLQGLPPTAPSLQAAMFTTENRIKYGITAPQNNGGHAVYQYIIYYKKENENDYQTTIVDGNELTGYINNLDGHSRYSLYVIAKNVAGVSPNSDVVTTGKIYGAYWDGSLSSELQRTDDAVGLVAGTNGDSNDFDNIDPWRSIHRYTDKYNNVMVRIPKFYIYKNASKKNGLDTWKISCDNYLSTDKHWYLPKCFWDFANKQELPYVDVGAYLMNNNHGSVSGWGKITSNQQQDIRHQTSAAWNNGSTQGYQLLDVNIQDILQVLFTVEFATINCHNIFNSTNATNSFNTGETDGLSGSSNMSSSGVVNYRGIEDLWGTNMFVDGYNQHGSGVLYVCTDPNQYLGNTTAAPYVQVSIVGPANNQTSYITSLGYDPNNPEVTYPDNNLPNSSINGDQYHKFGDAFCTDNGGSEIYVWGNIDWDGSSNNVKNNGGLWAMCFEDCWGSQTGVTYRIAKKVR